MTKRFVFVDGRIAETQSADPDVFVVINANDDEKKWFIANYAVDEHTFNSAFDPEEPARLEYEPEHLAVIFKRPKTYKREDSFQFKISSCGLFLFRDTLIITLTEDIKVFTGKRFRLVKDVKDLFLKVLYSATGHFMDHLKTINMISEEIESKLVNATGNKDLMNMFSLEKTLVYYLNAISSNGSVIERLKANPSRTGFNQNDLENVDDLMIENQQCYKQAEIYSNIFASLTGARASIVSNNLNIQMKNLNAVVIALAIPSFFAGVGGMSELTTITGIENVQLAYGLFFLLMIIVVFATIKLLQFMENKARNSANDAM